MSWVHIVNLLILAAYAAAFVMLVVITVTLVKILRALKARKGSAIEVAGGGSEEAGAAFAGVDPRVVAAIAAAVTAVGQAEGKKLVVRSVRRGGGWADAGRRESAY